MVFWFKILISALFATIASLSTFLYGFRFAEHYLALSSYSLLIIGFLLGLIATAANIILGTYSLVKIRVSHYDKRNLLYLIISFLGAIPVGFICYFGYRDLISTKLNIEISLIVLCVNAGIYYTAINNMVKTSKRFKHLLKIDHLNDKVGLFYYTFAILTGFIVSLIGFFAASTGINNLLITTHHYLLLHYKLDYLFAFITWAPFAALFINANYAVAHEMLHKMADNLTVVLNHKIRNTVIIIFCLCSGSSLAEMAFEIFNNATLINGHVFELLINYCLVPLALFSSAAVNYYSIKGLINIYAIQTIKSTS